MKSGEKKKSDGTEDMEISDGKDHLEISPNRFVVDGCFQEVSLLQVEDRPQFILMVGEDHSFVGNSDTFLKALAHSTNCPIDVLIEKPFGTYWRLLIKNTRSNLIRFYFPPFDVCTDPDKMPLSDKDIHLPPYKEYKTNCLDPFKGKIKFWGTDIRRTSLFYLVQRLTFTLAMFFDERYPQNPRDAFRQTIQSDTTLKKWFKSLKQMNKALFDFQMYNFSPDYFEKQIRDRLVKLYKHTPDFLKEFALGMEPTKKKKKTIEEDIETILRSKDKSHRDLAKKVWKLTGGNLEVIKNVQSFFFNKMEADEWYLLFCNHMVDVESILRIYKLIQKQKEGILVFFAGSQHTSVVQEFITHSSAKPSIRKIRDFPCPEPEHKTEVQIPNISCTKKPVRMRQYEKTK